MATSMDPTQGTFNLIKENIMKFKLNKSKLKDLSTQTVSMDATKKIAGGVPDPHTKMVNCAGPHTKCTNCNVQIIK